MTTQLRVGRLLAPALFIIVLAGRVAASPLFSVISAAPMTLTPTALTTVQTSAAHGDVSADRKSITFMQKVIHIVAVTGPDKDMLSYRIAGLRNPSLIVPRGATLRVLFVNTDDDMFHNIRFGAPLKTYPNVMTPYLKLSVGTPELPHVSGTTLHGEMVVLHAPTKPGTYVYLCTVRGHAQGGMVGAVIVH